MADVDDEMWDEFHRVVNMTSRELSEWLRTRDAGEDGEELPDRAGTPTGQRVLAILGKRRADLTTHDASGISARDFELAERMEELARRHGAA